MWHVLIMRGMMINFNKPSLGTDNILLITSDKLTPPSHYIINVVIILMLSYRPSPGSS